MFRIETHANNNFIKNLRLDLMIIVDYSFNAKMKSNQLQFSLELNNRNYLVNNYDQ